jgi:hypothetical protein
MDPRVDQDYLGTGYHDCCGLADAWSKQTGPQGLLDGSGYCHADDWFDYRFHLGSEERIRLSVRNTDSVGQLSFG